jgi:hypothetical protein
VLCVTLLNVALPTLVRDLHASTTELQWTVDAYILVFAGLLLVSGSVADSVGRKKVFCAGLLAFAAGSAWAAFSGSTGMLIAARAAMGTGGATMMPATLSLITSIFTEPAERQRAIGVWAGTTGRVRLVGAQDGTPHAPPGLLLPAGVLRRRHLGRADHVRPVRDTVPADPVPAVRPGVQRARDRRPGATRGRGDRGHRPAVLAAAEDRGAQIRDRRGTGGHRRRPVADLQRHRGLHLRHHPARNNPARHRGGPRHTGGDGIGHGTLPGGEAGIGSAANGAFLQTGGALGVAVMGSLLNTRYASDINAVLAPYHVPPAAMQAIRSSLGGARQVAAQAGGQLGTELAHVAKAAFVSGMDLGLITAAAVALGGCLIALAVLPARHARGDARPADHGPKAL